MSKSTVKEADSLRKALKYLEWANVTIENANATIEKAENLETTNTEIVNWLVDRIESLASLDEPDEYAEQVKRCKKDKSKDYYTGLYEGIGEALISLSFALDGNFEYLDKLIADTENENVCHWETYEPVEDWELEE